MDEHVLVNDSQYEGKYVALQSVNDHTVIAEGDSPQEVVSMAKEKGVDKPMVMFVPDSNTSLCV